MNIGVIKFYVWVEMRLSCICCMFGLKSVLGNTIHRFRHHTIHGRYKYIVDMLYVNIFIHIFV